MDPRRPRAPELGDDVVPGLPAIDGAASETALETRIDLDVHDDEASALDDTTAGELAGSMDGVLDVEPKSVATDDDQPAPLEADPSLAAGENERWTEGSDASEDTPWQEPSIAEPTGSAIDRGEEGFDDPTAHGHDALPGLPAAHAGDTDDEDADELDVNEADALETGRAESDAVAALPRVELPMRWHGPEREAARAIAAGEAGVLVAARGLLKMGAEVRSLALPFDAEVSAILAQPGERAVLLGTDAGEVWSYVVDGAARRLARPGTDDASLGGLDLASIAGVVVARTRGGALFRSQGEAWTGPIVARNVRRIRSSATASGDWLVAVVGSAAAPELLATRDARTFERLRGPESEIAVDAARSADVVAVACASGRLFVSRDAGAHYARVEDVVDVERAWVLPSGVVLAATFHEASDGGRLLRVDAAAVVVLDVAAEAAARRLSGPGEMDGDGRIHALVVIAGALWVATGVGVFEIAMDAA